MRVKFASCIQYCVYLTRTFVVTGKSCVAQALDLLDGGNFVLLAWCSDDQSINYLALSRLIETQAGQYYWRHRAYMVFKIVFTTWFVATSALFYRISRQPFPSRQKWEQYETVFKGTTLAAALATIGMGGFPRSSEREVDVS